MSIRTDGNAHAFIRQQYEYDGLTKREYFAGLMMQGLLACPGVTANAETCAKAAIEATDALIAALNL